MFIPGFLIGWATFPGVIIHELAHERACRRRHLQVFEVKYFSLGGGGYVQHAPPRNHRDTFAISLAPFLVNTIVSVLFYTLAAVALVVGVSLWPLLGWLGLSVGWHAIPSTGDTKIVWRSAVDNYRSSALALVSLPFALFLLIANALKYVWFDAIYSIGLGVIVFFIMNLWIGL